MVVSPLVDALADSANDAFPVVGMDFISKCIECAGKRSGFIAVDLLKSRGPGDRSTADVVLPGSHSPAVKGQLKTQLGGFRRDARVPFTLTGVPFAIEQLSLGSFKPTAWCNVAKFGHGCENLSL